METIFKYRILYADTDAMGVVYYGNYLRIYEAARGDFMRQVGLTFTKLLDERGIICPVVNATINYHKYARLDDEIIVKTRISQIHGARMVYHQEIYNAENQLINDIDVTVAYVNMQLKRPVRCPEDFNIFLTNE